MAEEKKAQEQRQLKTRFVEGSNLPTIFVNTASVNSGLEEFYLTLGTALPIEINDIDQLKHIDAIDAQAFFRCAMTRNTMRQIIDLMEVLYSQQTQQIEAMQQLQGDKD
jgi:hypothetical protein